MPTKRFGLKEARDGGNIDMESLPKMETLKMSLVYLPLITQPNLEILLVLLMMKTVNLVDLENFVF